MLVNIWRGNKTGVIHLRRYSKIELVKAVQEKEKQGYECITPIRQVYKRHKDFVTVSQKVSGLTHRKGPLFKGQFEQIRYECAMKKVE